MKIKPKPKTKQEEDIKELKLTAYMILFALFVLIIWNLLLENKVDTLSEELDAPRPIITSGYRMTDSQVDGLDLPGIPGYTNFSENLIFCVGEAGLCTNDTDVLYRTPDDKLLLQVTHITAEGVLTK